MSKTEFIYGFQPVREILNHQPQRVRQLYLVRDRRDQRIQALEELARIAKVEIIWLARSELDQMLGTSQHQGMAVKCLPIMAMTESMLEDLLVDESKPVLLLILDGIQDPHNLGACIRTANAMGVAAVIAPKDRAVGLTEIVHKTACGATAVTPFIQVTNLARTLRDIKKRGVWVVGLEMEGSMNICELNPGERVALVAGAEGEGLRRLTRENCDYLAHIPMTGTVGSLNVSVAVGIALYQIASG